MQGRWRRVAVSSGSFNLLLVFRLVSSASFVFRTRVGLEIELDEEEEVGEDDGQGNHVGPHDLPRRARRAVGDGHLEVHVGRNGAGSDVQAELDNLELSHVLLPPYVDLQDGTEVVVVL